MKPLFIAGPCVIESMDCLDKHFTYINAILFQYGGRDDDAAAVADADDCCLHAFVDFYDKGGKVITK